MNGQVFMVAITGLMSSDLDLVVRNGLARSHQFCHALFACMKKGPHFAGLS
jgi:hypothetical protein